MTTTTTPAAAAAANMDPQIKAQLLRAARGVRQAPATAVPMGIRYRTPAAPARPAPIDRRPRWVTLAPAGVREEIAETAPRRTTPARPAAPAPVPPASTQATGTDRLPAPRKPATRKPAARTPIPAPRVAEPARPRVLGSYDAFACLACGSRYGLPFPDHGCGPLTPVTVTITTTIAGDRA